jgi:hypothetical protein
MKKQSYLKEGTGKRFRSYVQRHWTPRGERRCERLPQNGLNLKSESPQAVRGRIRQYLGRVMTLGRCRGSCSKPCRASRVRGAPGPGGRPPDLRAARQVQSVRRLRSHVGGYAVGGQLRHAEATNKMGPRPDMAVVSTRQRVWNVLTGEEIPASTSWTAACSRRRWGRIRCSRYTPSRGSSQSDSSLGWTTSDRPSRPPRRHRPRRPAGPIPVEGLAGCGAEASITLTEEARPCPTPLRPAI